VAFVNGLLGYFPRLKIKATLIFSAINYSSSGKN